MNRTSRGDGSFFQRYRPSLFSEIVPTFNVSKFQTFLHKRQHKLFLLHGESRAGKTTAARVAALYVNCLDDESFNNGEPCLECANCKQIMKGGAIDVIEINGGDNRKIDNMREVVRNINQSPMFIKNKVYIIDECHMLTPEAKKILYKPLEELPPNVYVFMCTTEFSEVDAQIRNRAQQFQLKAASTAQLTTFLREVSRAEHPEGKSIPDEPLNRIIELSGNSPGIAIMKLEEYFNSVDGSVDSPFEEDAKLPEVKLIAPLLLSRTPETWAKISAIISQSTSNPEDLRISLGNYLRAVLLKRANLGNSYPIFSALQHLTTEPLTNPRDAKMKLTVMLYKAAWAKTKP